jgi:hypothetical protein
LGAFSMAAWSTYFQNCLSSFLAWANAKGHTTCETYIYIYIVKWGCLLCQRCSSLALGINSTGQGRYNLSGQD